MRFSVDAHAIGRKLTGNEVYIRNLLKEFDALDGASEFIAYVSDPGASLVLPSRFHTRRVSANPFIRLGWDLASCVRRDRPHLLHVQYTAPVFCGAPTVVSVHDVSFLEHPEYFPPARAFQLRTTVRRSVARAARILTPSHYSARAIRGYFNLPDEKVVITPNGVSSRFRPIPREQAEAFVRARFRIPGPYVLTVGDLQPRKNQAGLIRAFQSLLEAKPSLPQQLVLTGKDSLYGSEVRSLAARFPFPGRVQFTGFVSDDDLVKLYAGCDVFAFPSFYEGFGLPILEAMACGRAVACSSTTACGEVADSAAILFDPASVDDIARSLHDLLVDTELRSRMERLGLQRASQFHWRQTAERTLHVYHEVAGAAHEIVASRRSVAVPH